MKPPKMIIDNYVIVWYYTNNLFYTIPKFKRLLKQGRNPEKLCPLIF